MEFLQLKKTYYATTILVFLKHLSKVCLSLILVAFENAPIYGNLKYTFFIVISSVFIDFGSVLNLEKICYLIIYNKNRVYFVSVEYFHFIDLVMKYYISTVNIEYSMNETLYKTVLELKGVKLLYF